MHSQGAGANLIQKLKKLFGSISTLSLMRSQQRQYFTAAASKRRVDVIDRKIFLPWDYHGRTVCHFWTNRMDFRGQIRRGFANP